MTVELINTGAELLLGRTLNTHQQWLCRRLSDLGHEVLRQVAVADVAPAICQAVRESLGRADAVITTGGLGPTSDDLTRESLAGLLGRPLKEDPAVALRIEEIFRSRGREMPARARVQAQVPEGATVLLNRAGTAPGLALVIDPNPFREAQRRGLLIMLPGPPRELRPMFTEAVVPLLEQTGGTAAPFVCETLRTTGVPESMVQETIQAPLGSLVAAGLNVAYCARPGEVDIRLSARGEAATETVQTGLRTVRAALPGSIYTESEEELETVLVRILRERQETLAIAESCTGGLIAHRITNVPGASQVLLAGWVTYSNEAKARSLDVPQELLDQHGAVSEPVARAMAEGARRATGSDWALAVTGIAGPTGGSEAKPVGTVYLALAGAADTVVLCRENRWDRLTFKQVTAQQALDLARRRILKLPLK
jgi:nicotinamide-nucleotide amidase